MFCKKVFSGANEVELERREMEVRTAEAKRQQKHHTAYEQLITSARRFAPRSTQPALRLVIGATVTSTESLER